MSKLGKIYEVRYGDNYYTKIVYPVVYENQAQWLCKVPGSSDIIHIYKSSHKVYTASEFLEKIESKKPDFTVYVLVKPGEEVNFEKYRTVSSNEINLKKLEAKLNYEEKRIEIWKNEIEDTKKRIDDMKVTNRQTKAKIAQLKALIEKEKSGNEQL